MPQLPRLSTHGARIIDDKELDARTNLARTILTSVGDFDLASSEVNKILILAPDNLQAILLRACQAVDDADFCAAERDIARVCGHPELEMYAHQNPSVLTKLHHLATHLLHRHKTELAQVVAHREKELAKTLIDRWGQTGYLGWAYYDLARINAVRAANDPDLIDIVARYVDLATSANQQFMDFFMRDRYFDPLRSRIRAALPLKPKPSSPKGNAPGGQPPAGSEPEVPVLSSNQTRAGFAGTV
jgi:hypothetical protein